MSRLSGFFYAYIKPASAAFDTAPLLAIFPNRRIADDWWRAVEQSNDYKSSDDTTVTIERATSQLYLASHPGQIRQNLLSRLIEVNQEHGFEVLFLDGEKPSHPLSGLLVIPPDPHRDLISGECYFIRSAADPTEYWHIAGANVLVSKTQRTPFRISLKEPRPGSGVMVASDHVSIEDMLRPREVMLRTIEKLVYLRVTPDGEQKKNFLALGRVLYHSRLCRNEAWQIRWLQSSDGQKGEIWEVV